MGIFGILCGLWPQRGLLATRGGFVEYLAGFNIIQIGTSPYLTSTLVSIMLWSSFAVNCIRIVLLWVLKYWDSGNISCSGYDLEVLKPHCWPPRLV